MNEWSSSIEKLFFPSINKAFVITRKSTSAHNTQTDVAITITAFSGHCSRSDQSYACQSRIRKKLRLDLRVNPMNLLRFCACAISYHVCFFVRENTSRPSNYALTAQNTHCQWRTLRSTCETIPEDTQTQDFERMQWKDKGMIGGSFIQFYPRHSTLKCFRVPKGPVRKHISNISIIGHFNIN